ncbi:MAG: hypothetical protein HN904_24160 [Victivallales bacterium]|nr:hypothetical protein [Victivallales bacterium]
MDRRTFNRGIAATVGLAALPIHAGQNEGNPMTGKTLIEEGFEDKIPDLHTYQATYAASAAKAHGGKQSLRVNVAPGKSTGGAYFRLDGLVRPGMDYEFSAWVFVEEGVTARLYMSASDGTRRHTKNQASGGPKAGKWMHLSGTLRRKEIRDTDRDFMMAMVASGVCWFDDVLLREVHLPPPPIEAYPSVVKSLRGVADRHATALSPGETLVLDARSGAMVSSFVPGEAQSAGSAAVALPPDGLLVFAIDAPRAMMATGSIVLEPDRDLRPGLRATVLCDSTVLAAPMVMAEPWQGEGNPLTGPAPDCVGQRPPNRVGLTKWLLPEGRHYLFVSAPHFRSGGTFQRLELRALEEPVRAPAQRFALLSDTHIGAGRGTWMNNKLSGPAPAELAATLRSLRTEGIGYAFIAGDMTDGATRDQFATLGQVCGDSGLPIYGCIGNHDAYHASSRPDALELCAGLFPDGRTDYAVRRGNLRFIVLDGSHWRAADGTFMDHYKRGQSRGVAAKPEQIDWLRQTLAADLKTPTIFIWHYPLYNRGGISSCGYRMAKWNTGPNVLAVLQKAPNLIAALCGHTHWNEANVRAGATHLVNPAFCEWPNAYRVFRVYDDHLEWELRQVANRGFGRESFVVPKALSWMLSTGPGDLGGRLSV